MPVKGNNQMRDSMRQTLGGFFVGVMTSLFIMVSKIRNSQTRDKAQSLSLDLRLGYVENAERISICNRIKCLMENMKNE